MAFRRPNGSHACARRKREISGRSDPNASWGRRNAALSLPHRQRAAPSSIHHYGILVEGVAGGPQARDLWLRAVLADREWGAYGFSNTFGLLSVPHSAFPHAFLRLTSLAAAFQVRNALASGAGRRKTHAERYPHRCLARSQRFRRLDHGDCIPSTGSEAERWFSSEEGETCFFLVKKNGCFKGRRSETRG